MYLDNCDIEMLSWRLCGPPPLFHPWENNGCVLPGHNEVEGNSWLFEAIALSFVFSAMFLFFRFPLCNF